MKAADLLQTLLTDNNLSINLNTPIPVQATDGSWHVATPTLVVSYTIQYGQPKTTSGGDSKGNGTKEPRPDNGSQPTQ